MKEGYYSQPRCHSKTKASIKKKKKNRTQGPFLEKLLGRELQPTKKINHNKESRCREASVEGLVRSSAFT